MLNRFFLILTSSFFLNQLNAQNLKKIQLSTELGIPIGSTSDNLSLFLNVEPQLKISEHLLMGIRLGIALNTQNFEFEDKNQFVTDPIFDHGFLSVIPTLNYYWNEEFKPFIGIGIGPYSLANQIDIIGFGVSDPREKSIQIDIPYKIGGMLRAGFEFEKFRFGLEYNYIPKFNLKTPFSKTEIGTVERSYFGFNIGYIIGAWD